MNSESAFRFPLPVLVLASTFLVVTAQGQASQIENQVYDHRPVAAAIESLILQYPVVVTYEDPRYEYEGDIQDVTAEVRSGLYLYASGEAPRVLVPLGGPLTASYIGSPDTGEPQDWEAALQGILDSNEASANAGRFQVQRAGEIYHVIPRETRSSTGEWIEQASILDAVIEIPAQELDGFDMLQAIADAVSRAAGVPVAIGTIPHAMFRRHRGPLEAQGEPARGILMEALQSIDERLTWRLLYGPGRHRYTLNVRAVAAAPAENAENSAVSPPPGEPQLIPETGQPLR